MGNAKSSIPSAPRRYTSVVKRLMTSANNQQKTALIDEAFIIPNQ